MWDQFFRDYDPLIRSVVSWKKWHFDSHTQDDVAQTIRTQLTKAIERYHGDSKLEYYIKQICIRRCIDQVRKQVRVREHFVSTVVGNEHGDLRELEVQAGEDYDPIARVMRIEKIKGLRKVLLAMDETCRSILKQFYIKGLSYKEIAQSGGITVNAVGLRLSKCVSKLAAMAKKDPTLATYFSM